MSVWQDRAKLRTTVRRFFEAQNYLEVDTPAVVDCPGVEVHLQFFETTWKSSQGESEKKFLRTSPEIHLKKILASGHHKVFEIASCFRNHGELSHWHNPEFTMIEWYAVGATLAELMNQTEALLKDCYQAFSLAAPKIQRFSLAEAFERCTGVNLTDEDPKLATKLKAAGCISINDSDDFETVFFKAMMDKVEPWLSTQGVVFLYDYPKSTAALAKIEGGYAKRFECYVRGVELCNGFQELLGGPENRIRIDQVNERRKKLYDDQINVDEDFIDAVSLVKQPTAGNAMGFERLLAILKDQQSIDSATGFRWRT